MSDLVKGILIGIGILYIVQVGFNYFRLYWRRRKVRMWNLEDGKFYMIQNKSGFWFRAVFIDSTSIYVEPFFKRKESSFNVAISQVHSVRPDGHDCETTAVETGNL